MFHVFLLSNIAAFYVLLTHHIHMYQLNYYDPAEEGNRLRENRWPNFGRVFGFFLSIAAIVIFGASDKFKISLAMAIFFNIASAYLGWDRTVKIPLKYTKRVIRLFVSSMILYLLLVSFCMLLAVKKMQSPLIAAVSVQALPFFAAYVMMLADYINKPIEKSINQGFIDDAKRIIAADKKLTVIGVTGSYGKTSVKNILKTLLAGDYNVLATPGNFNTTLGVVITIRQHLTPLHDIFVCEMGAKKLGEIKEICDIAKPKYGIITSIGPCHLETFGSMGNIVKTKFELQEAVEQNGGTIFLNYDNDCIRKKTVDSDKVVYFTDESPYAKYKSSQNSLHSKDVRKQNEARMQDGNSQSESYAEDMKDKNSQNELCAKDIKVDENGTSFTLNLDGKDMHFQTSLLGKHNIVNISGCIALAKKLGVSNETLVSRVKMIQPVQHRQEVLKRPFGLIIDDAYNSNPDGAKSALDTLSLFDMTKIVVTPGMIELGDEFYLRNRTFGEQIADVADYVVLVGEKQTAPIQDGLNEKGYPNDKIYIYSNMADALSFAVNLKTTNKKAVLIENDLPDNY